MTVMCSTVHAARVQQVSHHEILCIAISRLQSGCVFVAIWAYLGHGDLVAIVLKFGLRFGREWAAIGLRFGRDLAAVGLRCGCDLVAIWMRFGCDERAIRVRFACDLGAILR